MNIAFILAIVGIAGYFFNLRLVEHYMRIKAYQLQEEGKAERRRSSENRDVKNKADKRLMKEVPKLKWTVWFGSSMLVLAVVGFVWLIVDVILAIVKK